MTNPAFAAVFTPLLGSTPEDEVEMVFDDRDLVVRARLDTTGTQVISDFFARDLRGYRPDALPLLYRAVLTINDLAARVGDYSVGIDDREILVLTGRAALSGLTPEGYITAMVRWLEQVDRLREVAGAIGMENFSLVYALPDDAN